MSNSKTEFDAFTNLVDAGPKQLNDTWNADDIRDVLSGVGHVY